MTLVAGQPVQAPAALGDRGDVATGLDAADDAIIERMGAGDLVITADIPLAARAVKKAAPR